MERKKGFIPILIPLIVMGIVIVSAITYEITQRINENRFSSSPSNVELLPTNIPIPTSPPISTSIPISTPTPTRIPTPTPTTMGIYSPTFEKKCGWVCGACGEYVEGTDYMCAEPVSTIPAGATCTGTSATGCKVTPEIVELFACGDYCPNPREQYLRKVFKGVTTKEECDKYGGEFSSFTGWGTVYFCKVLEN